MRRFLVFVFMTIGIVLPLTAQSQEVWIDASQPTDTSVARYQTLQEAIAQFNPGGLYYEALDVTPNIFNVKNTAPVGPGTGQILFTLKGSEMGIQPGEPGYCRATVIVRADPTISTPTYTSPTTEYRPIILVPELPYTGGNRADKAIAIDSIGSAYYRFENLIFMPPVLPDKILGSITTHNDGDVFWINWNYRTDPSSEIVFKNCLLTSNAGDTTPGCYENGLYGNCTVKANSTIIGDEWLALEAAFMSRSLTRIATFSKTAYTIVPPYVPMTTVSGVFVNPDGSGRNYAAPATYTLESVLSDSATQVTVGWTPLNSVTGVWTNSAGAGFNFYSGPGNSFTSGGIITLNSVTTLPGAGTPVWVTYNAGTAADVFSGMTIQLNGAALPGGAGTPVWVSYTLDSATWATNFSKQGPKIVFDNTIITQAKGYGTMIHGGVVQILPGTRFDYNDAIGFCLWTPAVKLTAIGTPSNPISFSGNNRGARFVTYSTHSSSNQFASNLYIANPAAPFPCHEAYFQYCNFDNALPQDIFGVGVTENIVNDNPWSVMTMKNCNIRQTPLGTYAVATGTEIINILQHGVSLTIEDSLISWLDPGRGYTVIRVRNTPREIVLRNVDVIRSPNATDQILNTWCIVTVDYDNNPANGIQPGQVILDNCRFVGGNRTGTDWLILQRANTNIQSPGLPVFTLTNCTFDPATTSNGRYGIYIDGVTSFTATSCKFYNPWSSAMYAAGAAKDVRFEKCTFYNWGVRGTGNMALYNDVRNATNTTTFIGCTFYTPDPDRNFVVLVNAAAVTTQVNLRDCVLSAYNGTGVDNRSTAPGAAINVYNSVFAIGTSTPAFDNTERLLSVIGSGAATVSLNSVYYAMPYFASTDTANPQFLAVRNTFLAGKGTGGTNLAGSGSYVGGITPKCVDTDEYTIPGSNPIGTYVFGIGTTGASLAELTPVLFRLTSVTTTAGTAPRIQAKVTDAKHPFANDTSGLLGGQYFVSRYFTLDTTAIGISVMTAHITLTYTAADSTDANLGAGTIGTDVYMNKWDGATWTYSVPNSRGWIDNYNLYTITMNNQSSLSDWTISGPFGVPVELSRFEIEAVIDPKK